MVVLCGIYFWKFKLGIYLWLLGLTQDIPSSYTQLVISLVIWHKGVSLCSFLILHRILYIHLELWRGILR